jgi:hypothetical protein
MRIDFWSEWQDLSSRRLTIDFADAFRAAAAVCVLSLCIAVVYFYVRDRKQLAGALEERHVVLATTKGPGRQQTMAPGADQLRPKVPKLAALMDEAEAMSSPS